MVNSINLVQIFTEERLIKLRDIALVVVLGYLIIQATAILIRKVFWKNLNQQTKMLISKAIIYGGWIIIVFIVFKQLGIKLTALLGAAGVIGVVVGIASQTSIGNIVSGIFLISEKPFAMGDLIRVGDKLGVVYSIDLLSVKLKTLENLLIRIPNQTIISTEVTNITRFPIRRMDFEIGVAYKENLPKVMELLRKIARENPLCLDEPEPLILFKEFGNSSINMLYGIWFEKTNYVKVKNSIFVTIKETFDAEGIEIPFPHVTLYTGEVTKAFPVHVDMKSK